MIKREEILNEKTIKEEEDEIPIKVKSKQNRSLSPPIFNKELKNRSDSNYHLLKKNRN